MQSPTDAGTYAVYVAGMGTYAAMERTAAGEFTIAKAASTIKLAAQTKTYTGKALAYSGKVVKSGSAGKVTYKYYSNSACTKAVAAANVKNVGTYYVKGTVATDANHAAKTSAVVKFIINPKGTAIKTLKATAGGFTVTWTKQAAQTTGYQVRYSTDAKFSKNVKTVTIASTGTLTKKVTGLKAKTKYYVQVRTYKKVGSVNYFSAWSSSKYVVAAAAK